MLRPTHPRALGLPVSGIPVCGLALALLLVAAPLALLAQSNPADAPVSVPAGAIPLQPQPAASVVVPVNPTISGDAIATQLSRERLYHMHKLATTF